MSKRNGSWQMKEDKHQHPNDILDDYDTFNEIYKLFHKGIDLNMIKLVYEAINEESAQTLRDDISALECRDYY
jgi:hypothetical protein